MCSDIITPTFSQSRRRWHMILLSIIARHRAQSVADSSSRKIRERDATGSRKKRLGYATMASDGAGMRPGNAAADSSTRAQKRRRTAKEEVEVGEGLGVLGKGVGTGHVWEQLLCGGGKRGIPEHILTGSGQACMALPSCAHHL